MIAIRSLSCGHARTLFVDVVTWETQTGTKSLVRGAQLLFGEGSAKANFFSSRGDAFGVSTSVAP